MFFIIYQSHQWMHTLMNRNSHVLSRHGVNRTSPQVEIPVLQRFNVYQKGGAAHKHVIFGEIAQLVEQRYVTFKDFLRKIAI